MSKNLRLAAVLDAALVAPDDVTHQLLELVYRGMARRYAELGLPNEAERLTRAAEEQEAARAEARFRKPSPYKLRSTDQHEARSLAAYKGHETRSENEHNVTVNVAPEYLALWEKVKASIRGRTPHQRWEHFMAYVEEHPGEAVKATVDQVGDYAPPSSRAA